jgi:NitT/TauT family transport system ATP-binding protein
MKPEFNQDQPVLEVTDLNITFTDENGSLIALDDLTFSIFPQEFVCILGQSGSGKSALLRVLAGLLKPSSGSVKYSQNEPRIGVAFQQANLMPWRTVLDNITLPLELLNIEHNAARFKAREWLELIGLVEFEKAYPKDLSGGMAQRVALARALIHEPDILLLDEPFASLDALTRERLGTELLNLWQLRHSTVIMVTHSISEALFLADRILIMSTRPGRVSLDYKVELPRPRTDDMRYTTQFTGMTSHLRNAIVG